MPTTATSSTSTHHGTSCNGNPSSAVTIELAWISGPGIRKLRVVDVLCWSCKEVWVAPITTAFPRTAAGSKVPRSTSTRLMALTVRLGPA